MARKVRGWMGTPLFFCKEYDSKEVSDSIMQECDCKGFRQAPYKSMILRQLILARKPWNFRTPGKTHPIQKWAQ